MKRVVITGIGVVSSIGTGKNDFLNAVKNGTSGIKKIPELQKYNLNCQIGGLPNCMDSPYLSVLEKHNLTITSSTLLYACLAGIEAWTDAQLTIPEYDSVHTDADTGIIVGSGMGSMDLVSEKLIPFVKEGKHKKMGSITIEQLLFSAPSSFLSGLLATGNMSTTNSNACVTGTEAIILGFNHIQNGKAKRMLVGGTEGFSPYHWACFDALRVPTTQFNEAPEKGSRPMSATASGLVPAAGAGILMLEELESALSRNATIYAEIAGGFLNSGGQRNGGTMSAPNPDGVIACIAGALKDSKMNPSAIDCISGHLTSTMFDVLEIKNWVTALKREQHDFPYINALKSMTGHSFAASGAIETIAAALEIKHQFIHSSINCEDVHPEIKKLIDVEKIPQTCMNNKIINVIAKTSFGFGDVNACLILKKITA